MKKSIGDVSVLFIGNVSHFYTYPKVTVQTRRQDLQRGGSYLVKSEPFFNIYTLARSLELVKTEGKGVFLYNIRSPLHLCRLG